MRWCLRLFWVALSSVAACTGDDTPETPTIVVGPDVLTLADGGRQITLTHDGVVRVRLPADAFSLGIVNELTDDQSYDPFWLVHEDALFQPTAPPGLRWRGVRDATARAEGDGFVVDQIYENGRKATLSIRSDRAGHFVFELVPETDGAPIAFMRLRLRADGAEAFYGLGEHLDDVNQRNKLRPMQMEADLSIESSNNEAHVPVPLLIGTTGWGVFVESRRLGVFDVARAEADLVEVTYGTGETSGDGLRFHLFLAGHPLDITKAYYDVTAAPLLPADWAYGPIIWRDENRNQAEVEDDIRMIRDLDLATSAIWIDRPYATAVGVFDFKPDDYPDPAAMIQTAHDAGLRVSVWHVPYVSNEATDNRALFETNGWFPPEPGLRLNGWSDLVDLTNADTYAWWQAKIQTYVDLGIEGFKLDYAEDVIPGLGGARTAWRFSDGSTEKTMHYGYTHLYHRVYAETLPKSGGFLLCRAGRWGDQANVSVVWPGDLDADFSTHREARVDAGGDRYNAVGGLPASVIMGLTLGPSGFPFFGADTGGYRHSPPDNETFIRWFQQTALSTVMQVGDSSSQPPWVFTPQNGRDDATLDLYRRYARLHLRLFPYVWTYAERLATDGRPIQRALGLAHPELGVHPSDTYLMGDDLLVAPVVARGQTTRDVRFPSGRWYDWWTGAVFENAATVAAPLDTLPLFVRAGGLIPLLRETIDTLAPATVADVESYADDPGSLTVVVAPVDQGSTEYTVFDGTVLSQRRDGPLLILGVTAGDRFQGTTFVVFQNAAPGEVRIDGTPSTAWTFADGRLTVALSPGNHQVEVQ